jgi:Fe2+ or Zn2+ uptake regulation protein
MDMDYVEYACDRLRANGFRITPPRRRVLSLLEGEERALSPYDIRNLLRDQGVRTDVVTIYRVLEVLERIGLAHRVYSTGGYVRCQQNAVDHHHHHLICTDCGRTVEITGDRVDEVVERVEEESGYRVAGHILELLGLCGGCRSRSGRQA